MGFGTHDANKKSEFTMQIPTERYREHMKIEGKMDIEQARATGGLPEDYRTMTHTLQQHPPEDFVYDYGKEKITKYCQKCHREMYYCKHDHTGEKRLNPMYAPMSTDFGYKCNDQSYYDDKEFAKRSVTAGFFDHSHI